MSQTSSKTTGGTLTFSLLTLAMDKNGKMRYFRFPFTIFLFLQLLILMSLLLFVLEIQQATRPKYKTAMFDHRTIRDAAEGEGLPRVKLFIAVLSAHARVERRKAVRSTWWTSCKQYKEVLCVFVTDSLDYVDNDTRILLKNEATTYQDIIFLPTHQGMFFGLRFLHMLRIGTKMVRADYFMRIDDDVLLCLDHLMHDLPSFPTSFFHWGFLHCFGYELVYIDEGITMFSKDIIDLFLAQNPNTTLCHPFGDQTYTLWIQSLALYRHRLYHIDTRIHHDPPASKLPALRNEKNICQKYIALHGVYGNDYHLFWTNRGDLKFSNNVKLLHPSDVCRFPPFMNWRRFHSLFRAEPYLCNAEKSLGQRQSIFKGRE